MFNNRTTVGILLLVFLIFFHCARYRQITVLDKPYLGQTPPGTTPQVFAPGFISTKDHLEFGCAWSPDGKAFYFTRRGGEFKYNTLMVCQWNDSLWTEPEVLSLSDAYPKMTPRFFPNGTRIVYTAWRPVTQESNGSPFSLWITRKNDRIWSDPKYFRPWFSMSVSAVENIYCHSNDGIGISKIAKGRYIEPEIFGSEINTGHFDQHPFVSSDESYFLFDSHRPGGYGDADLYVAFRDETGTWKTVKNLGDRINDDRPNFCPTISPDGKYIFYTTGEDIYWVDAKIIEDMKPHHSD